MAITRRQFIKRTALTAAGTAFGPALFRHPLVRQAFATGPNKYFILVYLGGGNDGLNTIVPHDNGGGSLRNDYEAARNPSGVAQPLILLPSELGLPPSRPFLDATGARLGFHPGFAGGNLVTPAGLVSLYEAGNVAVIQGCGYPNYSLSHEESRLTWQTGQPGLGVGTGWFGRYLANAPGLGVIPGVCISGSVTDEFIQTATNVLAMYGVANFGFPYDSSFGDAENQTKHDAFQALYVSAKNNAQSAVRYVGTTGTATLDASDNYPDLEGAYTNDRTFNGFDQTLYDNLQSGFANDLREVAKIIYGAQNGLTIAEHPTGAVPGSFFANFFRVDTGGYDTHSNQGAADPNGQHYQLHRNVGDALNVFAQDCVDMGIWNDVCLMVYSEFSRRIQQNDSGTDHGSQGPVFVVGGGVTGGVYGKHPNINDAAIDGDGNTVYAQGPLSTPYRSTDFRDIYGTILKHWLGMTNGDVQLLLPPDSGTPADHWTAANVNFDMGFV